ncbi:hypothetical protein [Streptomyces silaceus]|uniref:hypothetical protein n=1 Tax=Streptomyces silaceus TaxID=545123 RepID=UPI0006EB7801|nr:hypothetical protein [Streptomyces silaceus]
MSVSLYRSQLERKRKARADAERKAGALRSKESGKRADAAKALAAAGKSRNASTVKSKQSAAARCESQANAAAKEASSLEVKAARFGKEAAELERKLARAEKAERDAAEKLRARRQRATDRRAATQQAEFEDRLSAAEDQVSTVLKELPAPKPEKLRVLLLGAASYGDVRVGREQERIRAAVRSATHRDLVDLDVHPAATTRVFLDALTRFRPHVVHFSGHSADDLIKFERDVDDHHEPAIVSAEAFARAIAALDEKPLLVLLNSCHSAAQIKHLVDIVPFAIGMSDSILDGDAIAYAARFYAVVAEGQSIRSAHLLSRSDMELNGLRDHDLPTLACAPDVDPAATRLVTPPE